MQVTDTIADLLTRIRNAQAARHDTVEVPASNMKKAICQILVDEGYVKSYSVTEDGKQGMITITLKYVGKQPVIKVPALTETATGWTPFPPCSRRCSSWWPLSSPSQP